MLRVRARTRAITQSFAQLLFEVRGCTSGSSIVELALIAPLLVFVLAAGFQMAVLTNNYLAMDRAVRGAARYVARLPKIGADVDATRAKTYLQIELLKLGATVADPTVAWVDANTFRITASASFSSPLSSMLPIPTTLAVRYDQPYLKD